MKYIFKHKGDDVLGKCQQSDIVLIEHQILSATCTRNVWQTVQRIDV